MLWLNKYWHEKCNDQFNGIINNSTVLERTYTYLLFELKLTPIETVRTAHCKQCDTSF